MGQHNVVIVKNKKMLGTSYGSIVSVDCDEEKQRCIDTGIQGYTTWISGEGVIHSGTQSLEKLSDFSGYKGETIDEEIALSKKVKEGDEVSVWYIGTLKTGEVFDTNIEKEAKKEGLYDDLRTYEELSFTLGQGTMIPGFEAGVLGMNVGEKKVITIPPGE